MVDSNKILYDMPGERPDHCVVIKYVPYVADSKRAMDEYTSEIFMHGLNTIVMHNTCEVKAQTRYFHTFEKWSNYKVMHPFINEHHLIHWFIYSSLAYSILHSSEEEQF